MSQKKQEVSRAFYAKLEPSRHNWPRHQACVAGIIVYNSHNMKRTLLFLLLGLMIFGAGACSSVKPLKMQFYRKNVVVKADETIWVNGARIDLNDLRAGFLSQMIFQDTPIAVHFNQKLSQDYFDKVMGKLKSEGFRNYDCIVYRD